VRGSYFGSDCDSGCRVDRAKKRTSFVAVYGAIVLGALVLGFDFSPGDRCISDHHRTLLIQVHLLYFHACYGCGLLDGRALTLILNATLISTPP
jgi:hypothetical protein